MTQRPMERVPLHMSRSRLSVWTVILSVLVAILATSAPASAKAPKFSGAAPGSITCNLSAKVSFSPPLTHTGGGTSPSTVKAGLGPCFNGFHNPIFVKSAKVTGSFATSPLSCVTMSLTGAAANLNIKWKGTVTGTVAGTTYAGKANFTATTMSGATDTGSFAGGSALTVNVPSSLAASCAATKGVKKLTLTGTITLGTTCPVPVSGSWSGSNVGTFGSNTFSLPLTFAPLGTPGHYSVSGTVTFLTGPAADVSLGTLSLSGSLTCAAFTVTETGSESFSAGGTLSTDGKSLSGTFTASGSYTSSGTWMASTP
jgi:hypothetical protein